MTKTSLFSETAQPGDLIIFCDGAGPKKIRDSILLAMGAGWVMYDHNKVEIGAGIDRFEHVNGSANMAEILAIRQAMRKAVLLPQFRRVIILCDNKNAVGWAKDLYNRAKPHIRPIVDEILALKKEMAGKVRIYHIPREENEEADELSKDAYRLPPSQI